MDRSLIRNSLIYRRYQESLFFYILSTLYGWFHRQWMQSIFVRAFTSQRSNLSDSAVGRAAGVLYTRIHGHTQLSLLGRAASGSIFARPWLWSGITLVLAPLVPTKLVIGLATLSALSCILYFLTGEQKHLRRFPVNKFVYAFALIYVVAALLSPARTSGMYGSALTVFFTIFFVVFSSSIETYAQLKKIARLAVFTGVLVSLYGFYQYLTPGQRIGAWVDNSQFDISFRVYSTLDNPNVLGEYFLLVIPLGAAFLFTAKSWKARIIYLLCCGIMLACMVLTYSRGCWIGIAVAAMIFLVMIDRRFLLLGVLLLCAAPFVLPENILQRIGSVGDMSDSSTSYRVYIWFATIAMLKDYWFTGVGPGEAAFNLVYPRYSYNSVSAPHAHNLFLQITCDTGICGCAMMLCIFVSAERTLCTAIRREEVRENKIFEMAGAASVIGFFLQSMFDYTFYNYRVILLFWAYLAMYLLFTTLHRNAEGN